jgi:hypothetical protein
MDPRIFASYSRKDGTAFAVVLRQQLIEQNFSIWRDRRLAEAVFCENLSPCPCGHWGFHDDLWFNVHCLPTVRP